MHLITQIDVDACYSNSIIIHKFIKLLVSCIDQLLNNHHSYIQGRVNHMHALNHPGMDACYGIYYRYYVKSIPLLVNCIGKLLSDYLVICIYVHACK